MLSVQDDKVDKECAGRKAFTTWLLCLLPNLRTMYHPAVWTLSGKRPKAINRALYVQGGRIGRAADRKHVSNRTCVQWPGMDLPLDLPERGSVWARRVAMLFSSSYAGSCQARTSTCWILVAHCAMFGAGA